MLILMIASTICFAICTIPYSIQRIIYLQFGTTSTTLIETTVFTICLNMNYCYNFYILCLASKYFRQIFIQKIKRFILFSTTQGQARNTGIPMSTNTKALN
jgi:hypothetical protein